MAYISRIRPILKVQNLVFSLMFIAMLTVINARVPALYDGSYFLVTRINYGSLMVYSNRWGRALMTVPAMIVAHVTGKLEPATVTYCLTFAAIPLCVLILCWLIVRKEKPWLFVWPVVSMALVSMNMQLTCQAENLISCELMWPLCLGLLTKLTVRKSIMLVGLGVALISLHPITSVAFLGASTVIAFALARKREDARLLLIVGSILMMLGAVRFAVFCFFGDPIVEFALCGSQALSGRLQRFVESPPLVISTFVGILTGFMLLIAKRFPSRIWALSSVVSALISTSASIWIALHPMFWVLAWYAHRFNFLFVLSICLFASLDSLSPAKLDRLRTGLLVFICFSFLVLSSIQSANVLAMNEAIKRSMKASKTSILDASDYNWTYKKAFGDEFIGTYSIILQGKRRPKKIVLPPNLAVAARRTYKIRVVSWDARPLKRWFMLPKP